jgi:DNA repair protein RecN (Recombination protein N)
MIRFLSIRNLAVIDALEVEFGAGLNVLTGETGAGKSMLVGAVGLLVGGRASPDLVRTGEDTAAIQAIVEDPDGRELIVRREISAQGRSRAFLDGALTTTAVLRERCAELVDLHGQHEHQVLLDPASHLDLLDEFAGLAASRPSIAERFARWSSLEAERTRLATGDRDRRTRAEFLAFQLAEIDRAAPRAGEDDELLATRRVLANADRLHRICGEAYLELYDGDRAALAALGGVWRKIGELAAVDPQFAPYLEAREAIKPQLEDLAFFLRSYAAAIDASPGRLQEIEDRLALLERLKKKHGPALSDVIARREDLSRELADLEGSSDRASRIERDLADARAAYAEAAAQLSAARREAAATFAGALERSLADLAMPRTRCEIRFAPDRGEPGWTPRGMDEAEFFLSPNPGEDLRPLARIASGGELSRIMLALKTLASTDRPGKTLIFDEVDAGIGGAVADTVGQRLQRLGARYQVLCITHLPQIAAHGATHFTIAKTVRGDRTVTEVRRLDGPAREEELARMIGGAAVTAHVHASARDLLASRRPGAESEYKAKGETARAKAKGKRVG